MPSMPLNKPECSTHKVIWSNITACVVAVADYGTTHYQVLNLSILNGMKMGCDGTHTMSTHLPFIANNAGRSVNLFIANWD